MLSIVPITPGGDDPRPVITDSSGRAVGTIGLTSYQYSEKKHEFVVIGSRRNMYSESVLIVLQVEWHDCVAYRVNRGEIQEKAWIAAMPQRSLIAMR